MSDLGSGFDGRLDFSKLNGLIPAIAQDFRTGEVLMLAFMNEAAWMKTLSTGRATYYSRTRKKLWVKGETSGNIQDVVEIRIDCDADTVLLMVDQKGGSACHTGNRSCFYRSLDKPAPWGVGEPGNKTCA